MELNNLRSTKRRSKKRKGGGRRYGDNSIIDRKKVYERQDAIANAEALVREIEIYLYNTSAEQVGDGGRVLTAINKVKIAIMEAQTGEKP